MVKHVIAEDLNKHTVAALIDTALDQHVTLGVTHPTRFAPAVEYVEASIAPAMKTTYRSRSKPESRAAVRRQYMQLLNAAIKLVKTEAPESPFTPAWVELFLARTLS